MSREFLICAVAIVAIRFVALISDPTSRNTWLGISAAQLAMLALFTPTMGLVLAAMVLVGGNCLELLHARRPAGGEGFHLLSIGAQLVLLSVSFSPEGAPAFQAWSVRAGRWIGSWTAFGDVLHGATGLPALKGLLGLLLAVGEGDRLVRWLLRRTQATPAGALGQLDVDEFGRGRAIGMLERTLIYLFALSGQLGAVGFVVAAKAFVHARRTPERDITHYVLIGTLASTAVAVIAGLLARAGLSG